ncbi:peptidoglycan recognition protein [uncultured Cellulomonas sp.]|uniref:peptidoglycan recognition protein family protein n=1 Tax=uncultured Cellulomonas sp. TaxID=189682 RepID=UPI0028EAB613|nr:peptidoglycan recognition protein [uncultured Cellulomonas sp.]
MSIRAGVLVAALLVAGVPTAAQAAPAPEVVPAQVRTAEPVAPTIDELPVVVSPQAAGRRAAVEGAVAADLPEGEDRVRTGEIPVTDRQSLGVTWSDPAVTSDVEVRVRTGTGWSDWVELGAEATAPDTGTVESALPLRGGTGSVWIGHAEAVELSFPASDAPDDVRLALIGSGPVDAQAGAGVAARAAAPEAASVTAAAEIMTTVAAPRVISRGEWGAAAPTCTMDVASTLVAAVVHHTAGPNTYGSVAEAMAQIRNDQQYHQQSRGWCDIGYNFLVDKWGNVYEGRAGSTTAPVIGVHAGGFNTRTVGISLLGDYSSVSPSATVQESVARVIAWRLSTYYRDPASTTTYTTLGGENSRYPAGTTLALPVVLGHRDVAFTACPGQLGYGTLGWLRARAQQMVRPSFVNPALSATSVTRGSAVEVRAGALGNLQWTLTVTDAHTGILVSRSTGSTPSLGGIVARWDGRGPAGAVGAGPYRLLLEGSEPGVGTATAWAANVQVTGTADPPVVAPVPLGSNLQFVPVTPQRIADTRPTVTALGAGGRMDVKVTGVAGIPADAKAVALNLTAVHATSRTHLRAWPAGLAMPGASVLNTDPGRTVAAHVVLGVGGEGKVSVYNDTGSVHVAVDVSGYYVSTGGATFHALASPARLLDTRTSGPRLASGGGRAVQVGGIAGIPANATVIVNITSVAADAAGYLVAVPHGSPRGSASTVNHRPGGDATNRATVALSSGVLDVWDAGGSADVVVDVVGWYSSGSGALFTPIAPVRAFDTRTSGSALPAGQVRDFAVGPAAGVPADATSVVLNLTATQQSAWATYVTAWSGEGTRPATSDLNTGSGRDESNLAIVRPSSVRTIRAYNNLGSTHLVGDVLGYFR